MIQAIFRSHEFSKRRNFEPTKVRQSEISTDRCLREAKFLAKNPIYVSPNIKAKLISHLGQTIYTKQNASRAFPGSS